MSQQYYLKERDIGIRNQLVPVQVDIDYFQEAIRKYFKYQFEQTNNLSQNQSIEIEVKLGSFIAKEQNFQIMLDNFKFVSKFHHIFVTEFAQHYTFQPNFLLPPWLDYWHLDCNSFPQSYINLTNYFRNLEKGSPLYKQIYSMYIDPDKCQLMSNQRFGLRLDLVIQNGQRVSIYHDGTKLVQQKKRLDSLDIMKNLNQYRLTTNIETKFQLPSDFEDTITSQQIRTIRFKQYQMFQYQFLEISMSRVLQIDPLDFKQLLSKFRNNGRTIWTALLYQLLFQLYDVNKKPSEFKSVRENIGQNNRKCEIEFEIHDIEYFKQNLTTFGRMQRNIDAFFYNDRVSYDILHEQILKTSKQANRTQFTPPLIGNYLQTTYKMANKYL